MIIDAAVITAVTLGITQAIKPLLDKKWHPVLGLGIGTLLGLIAWPINGSASDIFVGMIAGLAANGLYDNIKQTKALLK